MKHYSLTQLLMAASALLCTASMAAQSPTVITQVEGETKIYSRQGLGTLTYWGVNVSTESQEGKAAQVVFAPDGETVYFRQLISQDMGNNTYVKGVIEGDKIRIPRGQYVSYDEEDERGLQLYHLRIAEVTDNEDFDWTYEPDEQDITFTIEGDMLVLDGEVNIDPTHQFPTQTIGLVYSDDQSWPGLSDYQTVLTLVTDQPIAPPHDATATTIVLTRQMLNTETGEVKDEQMFAKAVIAEPDIYLSGLTGTLPDGWIHGTLTQDGTAVFESRQFMGVGVENELVYFVGAQSERVKVMPYPDDPDFTEWGYSHAMTDRLTFDLDAATHKLTTAGTILLNQSADALLPLTAFVSPTIMPFVEKSATPQAPVVGEYFMPFDEDNEFMYISIFIPNTATDGSLLLTDKLSWRVLVNGEPFVFSPDEYPLLENEMNELPYGFSDCEFPQMGSFITYLVPGTLVYFYRPDILTIGVESIYRGGGEERVSRCVTFNTETQSTTTGIEPITYITNRQPISITYHDLQGRSIKQQTAKGFVIRRTQYSDGSQESEKLFIR